jgi:serine/threonine-protein kinase
MGAVYQAKQLSMDRLVAVKVMHKHVAAMPGLAPRFHREMKATSRIEHANTVRVFDFGSDENGQLFLAMEFLDGRPLSKLLAEEPRLPLPRLTNIAVQIARALGAAHAEGITHRDLKPDNVMLLDRYGERDLVKVVDFGIARFTDDSAATKMTADGALIGTPAYMSPEQAMGKPVDGRSDFYSLGVMLYEMAVGQPPFSAPTLAGILVAHATEAPAAPSSVAEVAPALEQLILQLLAKDPDQRPQSAEEIVKALAALVTAGTVPALATPTLPAAQSPSPRGGGHGLGIAATVIGLLAVAVVAVAVMKRHRTVAPPPPPLASDDARARLDALWRADGDPLPPASCRATDPALVDPLATAAARHRAMSSVSRARRIARRWRCSRTSRPRVRRRRSTGRWCRGRAPSSTMPRAARARPSRRARAVPNGPWRITCTATRSCARAISTARAWRSSRRRRWRPSSWRRS